MGRGKASRSRDQYEPVEDRKSRRCSCFYGFLIFLTIVILLAIIGGAAFAGWLLYNLRAEEGSVTYTYDVDNNGTESVYSEPEEVSGGDIQYENVVHIAPIKDKDEKIDDDDKEYMSVSPMLATPPHTQAPTTLGTASRILQKGTETQNGLNRQTTTQVVSATDEELAKISAELWEAAQPSVLREGTAYQLSVGRRINETIKTDESPKRLFSRLTVDLSQESSTYTTFLRLLDNYNYITRVPEVYNEADHREINEFLDALMGTSTIQQLQQFFVEKGAASSDTAAFREQLRQIWFQLYNRSPKYDMLDSSGFEHVFVGEIRKNKVIGFRSWIQLYLQEAAKLANYHGYYSIVSPHMMSVRMKWHEKTLRMTSFFVGTPPEYDIAVYTLCVMTRPGESCPITIGNSRVTVRTLEVKHVEGVQVADAYLAI